MYHILGLPSTASKSEIKKAYRRLAKQYHPDKNKSTGAQQKFVEIVQAYNYLMDVKSGKFVFSPTSTTRTATTQKQTAQDKRKKAFQRARITQDYINFKKKVSFNDSVKMTLLAILMFFPWLFVMWFLFYYVEILLAMFLGLSLIHI